MEGVSKSIYFHYDEKDTSLACVGLSVMVVSDGSALAAAVVLNLSYCCPNEKTLRSVSQYDISLSCNLTKQVLNGAPRTSKAIVISSRISINAGTIRGPVKNEETKPWSDPICSDYVVICILLDCHTVAKNKQKFVWGFLSHYPIMSNGKYAKFHFRLSKTFEKVGNFE
eukprot:jgi/Bigna1/144846/aug1.92_g19554